MNNPANYSVSTRRGRNMFRANPQIIGFTSDQRWAIGRNVKAELPEAEQYGVIEVWTLKERGANGRIRIVAAHVSREEAQAFVAGK